MVNHVVQLKGTEQLFKCLQEDLISDFHCMLSDFPLLQISCSCHPLLFRINAIDDKTRTVTYSFMIFTGVGQVSGLYKHEASSFPF